MNSRTLRNKYKAIKNIILGRPVIYRVYFDGRPVIKASKNWGLYGCDITNLTLDGENKYVLFGDVMDKDNNILLKKRTPSTKSLDREAQND